ncbi:efflux RND transporter periplasmic adaptor subunit [Vibrio viridaestus]|uniref:efflux RND transporter periplasmic adaptor subunit n=1 Tax=Vibrio viridaestus TaxID=2487322 RepID=UPI001AA03146|nr:hypothetical protein [Vibrio viridaestus]
MTSVATLRQLSDAADPATRTFEARYVLTGALQDAPLGSTVTINVTKERSVLKTGLQVPIGALFDSGKGTGVWSVDGEPAKVSWHPVTILDLDDDSALVSGPIKQGDQVVALGAHLLRDGEQVRVAGSFSGSVAEGARP